MDMSDGDLLNSPEEGEISTFGMDLEDILQGGCGHSEPNPAQEGGNVVSEDN